MLRRPSREPEDMWATRWYHAALPFLLWACGTAVLIVVLNLGDRDESRWVLPLIVVLTFYVSTASFSSTRRRNAYRTGWLAGRRAMIISMEEAAHRGMSTADWLESEIDRDLANLSRSMGKNGDLPEQS